MVWNKKKNSTYFSQDKALKLAHNVARENVGNLFTRIEDFFYDIVLQIIVYGGNKSPAKQSVVLLVFFVFVFFD